MGNGTWPTGIRPNGNGIQIRLWRGGKQVYSEQIAGNINNTRSLAAAVKRREELVGRMKAGLPLYTGDESPLVLFSDAAQEYMNELQAAYSTHVNYEDNLNRYWMPAFGKWPVTDITPKAIKTVLNGHNLAITSKRAILAPLRGVLDHAEVNPNPAKGIRTGRREAHIVRYSPDERQALLDNLSGQAFVYFALLFGCGLRPGEALGARWSDYDGETLHIQRTVSKRQLKESTKTYKRRKVYVPAWLRPILNGHDTRHRGGWIFLARYNVMFKTPQLLNEKWQEAHRKAGIPYRVPYVCRHTRASELLSQGIEPGDAAGQLGHTIRTFIDTYAEWIDEYSESRDMSRFDGMAVAVSKHKLASNWDKPEKASGKVVEFKVGK